MALPRSQLSEHPRDPAEDLHVFGVDGVERVVLRLEPHATVLEEETIDGGLVRGLVLTRERGIDIAVARVLSDLHYHAVVIEGPDVPQLIASFALGDDVVHI